MKGKKVIITLCATAFAVVFSLGVAACDMDKTLKSCGNDNHTYEYVTPSVVSKTELEELASSHGLLGAKKDGASYATYIENKVNELKKQSYDSVLQSGTTFSYYSEHFALCTQCGDIALQEHRFQEKTESKNGYHDIVCSDCDYTHENECDFSESSTCFCGKDAPQFFVVEKTDGTIKAVMSVYAEGDVVIPSEIDGKKVAEFAFSESGPTEYARVTSLTIPKSVEKITRQPNAYFLTDFPSLTDLTIEGTAGTKADEPLLLNQYGNDAHPLENVNAPKCYITLSCPHLTDVHSVIVKGGTIDVKSSTAVVTVSSGKNLSVTADTCVFTDSVTKVESSFLNVKTLTAPKVKVFDFRTKGRLSSLKTLNAPLLQTIYAKTFDNCTSLTNVTLGNFEFKIYDKNASSTDAPVLTIAASDPSLPSYLTGEYCDYLWLV